MKEMFNNKWAWAVLILVIINIVTIAAVWSSMCRRHNACERMGRSMCHERGDSREGYMHKGRHDGGGRYRQDFLSQELNLSPEQKASFKELQTVHFESMKKNMEEMSMLRKELMQDLGKSESDVDPIFQKISTLELNNQKMLFKHFNDMYILCTDSQKVLLKERLSMVMEHRKGGFSEDGKRGNMECGYATSSKHGTCVGKGDSPNCKMSKE
jgi:hypothetical protein